MVRTRLPRSRGTRRYIGRHRERSAGTAEFPASSKIRCFILTRVTSNRSYLSYWINGGHAWVSPDFNYPLSWHVNIPRGSASAHDVPVNSLDHALRVAGEHGLELDVDDWTYALMVKHGIAPPDRPIQVLRPTGEYPGTGPGDEDERPAQWEVIRQAPDFIGLTAEQAEALAHHRMLQVRLLDLPQVMTLESAPFRLTLWLQSGRVVSATTG